MRFCQPAVDVEEALVVAAVVEILKYDISRRIKKERSEKYSAELNELGENDGSLLDIGRGYDLAGDPLDYLSRYKQMQ